MCPRDVANLFLSLTPDRVLEAVEASGLRCRALCYPLNSFENRVYEVELEDRSRIIAKFYRPGRWSKQAILEEHAFLQELQEDEISVCSVRPFPDGSTLETIEGIHYSLSDRQGGRAPDELGDAHIQRLGRMVGRIHNVACRRGAPARPRLDADFYIRREVRFLREKEILPPRLQDRYCDFALELADIADRKMLGVAKHRVHADLHLGNVLERDGQLRVLDFDDFCTGPAVQDLWLALPGRGPETARQRNVFLEAYEEFRSFDRSTLGLIESLRALRLIRYATWIARRWNDPAFKMAWPEYGSDEYWQEQTDGLEMQLAVVKGEAEVPEDPVVEASAAGEEVEELLTNKDYFWDWDGE